MLDMLNSDLAWRLALAVGGVVVALGLFIAVLAVLKRRNSPLFIKGGRAREPRLMVLDAAAIDPKRRLVLVRRDNVEHLIMIGGPTDIVIETGIADRAAPADTARAATASSPVAPADRPRTAATPPAETSSVVGRPAAPPVQEPSTPTPESAPAAGIIAPAAAAAAPVVSAQAAAIPATPIRAEPQRSVAANVPAPVSSVSNLLYSDDREPLSGAGLPAGQPDRRQTPPLVAAATPPLAAAAESVLEQARTRVLSAQPAATPALKPEDAARALAAKLDAAKAEAARREALRRQQMTAPAATSVSATPTAEKELTPSDSAPSDFEKLLEAELEAGGLLRADATVAPVDISDRTVSDTRTRPDHSVERDIARRLGEMSVERKL